MDGETATTTRLEHLVNQVRWVTRISIALSSVAEVDDVYSVLISGLISPMGMGYTRALVFESKPDSEELRGKLATGLSSREELEELLDELHSETEFIEKRRSELLARAEEDESAADELRTLELGTQWVTLSQRLGSDTELTTLLQGLCYSVDQPAAENGCTPLFAKAHHIRSPKAFRPGEDRIEIPSELGDLLGEEIAVVPLWTKKGLRAVIILDRHLTGEPITHDDIESLDWFATQGALALQNIELIGDLEKAYDELKTVEQLKSNFLSIISHELRTPLTAISGFVELILNRKVGDVSDTHHSLLTRVAKNTGHLSNMVNDLIEIAEIKAEGMSDVSLIPVDPLETLFATLPKLEYRRRDNHVAIDPVFTGTVPSILCDVRALERIYFHLLDNAVKFSPPEETVTVEFKECDAHRLAISIIDHGEGIPADKLQRIFEEFYQIDNSLTRSHEGLGLGLAVTRILVQATRGEITVESNIPNGSRFTVVYPIAGNAARITPIMFD